MPLGLHQPLDPVAGIGGDEGDGVARLDLEEARLEHHAAIRAEIQHLDLVIGGEGGGGIQREGGNEKPSLHGECNPAPGGRCRLRAWVNLSSRKTATGSPELTKKPPERCSARAAPWCPGGGLLQVPSLGSEQGLSDGVFAILLDNLGHSSRSC